MMKKEKRFCMVAQNRPLDDFPAAIDEDLLALEEDHDQRLLLRKMDRMRRAKSYLQFLFIFLLFPAVSLLSDQQLMAQATFNPFAEPFSQLDQKHFPSGILHNRSPYYGNSFQFDTLAMMLVLDTSWMASPYRYSEGVITMQPLDFIRIYRDMLFAQVNDSVIVNPVDYYDSGVAAKGTFDVPMSIMAINFHRMDENAVASGKVYFDTVTGNYWPMPDTLFFPDSVVVNDTVIYPNGPNYFVVQNPDSLLHTAFEAHWCYGLKLPDEHIFVDGATSTVRYGLPSGLFISNLDTLPTVLVDFDDGTGFRTVYWDSHVDVSYSFPSTPKVQEVEIRVKMPSLNLDMVLKQSLLFVTNSVFPDTIVNTETLPFVCLPETTSTPAHARMSIIYANKTERKIRKPVIFIEGFETALNDYGDITFMNVINGLMTDLGFPEIFELPLLFDTLVSLGYDIVYLDFLNARDTIERNMLAVIKTIQWVNEELNHNQSNEKLVVAGASMGGLLARYALRRLEIDNCCHNTRLFISFDAPNQGANIPMGMQKLVEVASEVSKEWKDISWPLTWIARFREIVLDLRNPDVEETWSRVLNSPAARAMLIQHIDPDAGLLFNDFYNMLDSIGYPVNCRRIALINGSENGVSHTLQDTSQRLMGTGEYVNLPKSWMVLPIGVNFTTPLSWVPGKNAAYRVAYSTVWAESEPNYFAHNDWSTSIHNVNKIIGRAVAWSAVNTALGVSAAAASLNMPLLTAFLEGALIASKLKGNSVLENLHNQAVAITNYPATGLQNLTCAPGGLNSCIKRIGDESGGVIKVYSNDFSFIPSVSALDVKNVSLDAHLRYLYLANLHGLTPFDSYWASGRNDLNFSVQNQMHVEITQNNRNWIVEHIEHDWQMRSGNGRYQGTLASFFNYAKPGVTPDIEYTNMPHQSILYGVDILSGGTLCVNRQDGIGFQGNPAFPKPSGHFRLFANGDICDPAIVRIFNGGQMILGDQHYLNTAEVIFNSRTTLELLPGSQLIIYDNSKVVIETGATLVVHPGAEILLMGQRSVLEIKGRVVLSDGVKLSVSGAGFLRWNVPMQAADHEDYFSISTGSGILLEGTGQNDKKLEIATDTWFPVNLEVEVRGARVTIMENKHLHLIGKGQFDNVWFCAEDTNTFYGSVSVYGQKGVVFKNSLFSHATAGIKANLGVGGNPLSINGCLFRNNINGLYSVDEKIRLNGCHFANNYQHGWFAENMSGNSIVDYSLFVNNGVAGIIFDGQLSSSLLLRESEFTENLYGVKVYHALLQAVCSYFNSNGSAGILAGNMSQIAIDNLARNQIIDNHIGIIFDKALVVTLDNGQNRFSGNQYFLIGELLPNNYYVMANNTIKSIDLSGNHMPWTGNAIPVNLYITHPITQLFAQIGITCNNMVSAHQTVCSNPSPENEHIVKPFQVVSGVSVITGGRYNNYYLLDALADAAMSVSCEGYTGNDTLAIASFAEVMNNVPLLINEDERAVLDYALQLMTIALGNAIESGCIDPNRALDGMPADQYVEMIAQHVYERLQSVDATDLFAEELEARYALMMAQMYRVAEHYDYALNILSNYNIFSNSSLAVTAAYWECVCSSERLLLQGLVDKEGFSVMMDSCAYFNNARRKPVAPQLGYTLLENLNDNFSVVRQIYPNPVDRVIVIEFAISVENLEIELFDITGRKIWSATDVRCGSNTTVELPDVVQGYYMLKINADGYLSSHKIVKKKK